ncbi:glycosyltransferase family 39 protein [bacterium]|nr:glycosyltransferase family 39 protein [bacterium]
MKYLDPEKPSFAVIVFVFLSLLFTYPTIVQLSTHLIGGTADGWQFPWNNYVFRERVLNGEDPYYTDEVFYPLGVSLILHGYTEFNDVIGLILSPFFNDVAVTNLMVIFATFLSGFGAYLLTRELTGSALAGLFAGIAFAFCPFRMLSIIGHIHMALTQFLPLAIWTILKMAKTQKIKYAILTGLFFALACYCNYYFVIYLLIAFMLIVAYGVVRYKEWRTISFLRNLAISGAVAVLLLLPVAYHTYLLLKTGTAESYSGEEAFYVKNAADIGDYLRVAPLNRAILYALDKNPLIWPYSKVTSGLVVLLMFVPGIIFVFRKRPRYFGVVLFSGFVFFLLSLGPYLQITDSLRLPMLYKFISGMPILSHARSPERFGIMVNLVMAIVAGYMLS